MRNTIFISFVLPYFLECESRLLAKTTERALVPKNDDFKTVSITKHCLHGKPDRESHSSAESTGREDATHAKRSVEKAKIPLVKKPIPTYVEINYDDDYQTRMARWPEKYSDSSENEDEDFNLDDYEFDVNHDEYSTRGKPLEPRVKTSKTSNKIPIAKTTPVAIQIGDDGNRENKTNNKRQEAIENVAVKARVDDYYEDLTTKAPGPKLIYIHEDIGEDMDVDRDYSRKGLVRTIRSPWDLGVYIDKLGDKTSVIVNKVLSILPMFPQIPQRKNA